MSPELELALRVLGDALDVPDAPDLAARIALPPRRRRRRRPRRVAVTRRTLAIAAAATLLGSGTAMAVPASRDAVLEVLGLRGARIERVRTLPAIPPGSAAKLRLGRRIPLALARHAAVFTALVPSRADAAFLAHDVPGGRISFLIGPDLLIELRATSSPYFLKLIDPGTRAKRVSVGGGPGVYLSGAVHDLLFAAGDRLRSDRVRVAGNVLLWQRGALTLRIEGARSLHAALALARSLR